MLPSVSKAYFFMTPCNITFPSTPKYDNFSVSLSGFPNKLPSGISPRPLCSFIYLTLILMWVHIQLEPCGGEVCWGTKLEAGRPRVRFPTVLLEIFIDIILPAALWFQCRPSFQQKWVPGIIPGGKSGRCVELTTLRTFGGHCLEVWKPQPLGTLRVCPVL